MGDQDADLHIAFDPGTTTWTVCWKWSCSWSVHTLKFSSTYSEKESEELDATVGRSQSSWHYGLDVRYLDVQKFENIKLGILGQEPYTSELKQSFQATAQAHGVVETPVTLFENLFQHILATLAERYLDAPESEELIRGRRFQDIRKHCWVTYPVRHNDSLRIILFEAALAAQFHRVEGVSESMAAAHFVALQTKHQLFPAGKTALIGDCGGGSTDFVGVFRGPGGWIRQACATDGFNQGGLMINHAFQKWLYTTFPDNELLKAPRSWPTISSEFDGCKRVFNGLAPVRLDVFGETIQISVETMTDFFRGLMEGILRVFWSQYTAAQKQGHVPDVFFLCGGPARNKWFAKSIFDEIQKQKPGMACAAETHVGTVAQGALSFALNPFRETSVAGEDVGLTFLMDRTASGVKWRGDRVEEAIGWVIKKGHPAGDGSHVELIKTVYRDRPGAPNRVISSDLYTTNKQFDRGCMRLDHDVDWDCPITYPLVGVRSHLVYLGRIEANIPLDELFTPSTTHREVEARFIFSIRPEGQLLKVEVSLQRENGPRLLKKTYVPAASWTPQSELDLESGHDDPPAAFPRAKRPRRETRGRRVPPTVNTGIDGDPTVSEQPAMRTSRPMSASPVIAPASLAPSVRAEKDLSLAIIGRRPVENDTPAKGIDVSLPPGRVVRRSLGPSRLSFLLSLEED